jgi:hypothetical protein
MALMLGRASNLQNSVHIQLSGAERQGIAGLQVSSIPLRKRSQKMLRQSKITSEDF